MPISPGFPLMLMMLPLCPSITSCSALEVTAPKIVDTVQRCKGQRYSITCTVKAGGLKDETLLYWLANNSFLETAFSSDRVKSRTKLRTLKDDTDFLQTRLVVKDVTPKDFLTNFTCIALNPAGFDKKDLSINDSEVPEVLQCKRQILRKSMRR